MTPILGTGSGTNNVDTKTNLDQFTGSKNLLCSTCMGKVFAEVAWFLLYGTFKLLPHCELKYIVGIRKCLNKTNLKLLTSESYVMQKQ